VPLQVYGLHPVVETLGQVPEEVHLASLVWVVPLQLCARQTVLVLAGPQVPGVVPLQYSHAPLQAELQQTPSAQ
jgi:hypothetical protein